MNQYLSSGFISFHSTTPIFICSNLPQKSVSNNMTFLLSHFILFIPLCFIPLLPSFPLSHLLLHARKHTRACTCRLHDFVWHGEDPQTPGRFIPSSRKFVKLCHIPSQMYCNVKDVRTNDDALITVKLMLFYQLVDVDTMVSCVSIFTSNGA